MRILPVFVLLSAGLLTAACAKPVDLKAALQVTEVTGGYHDAGIVGGKNKLVPSITFRLKKLTNDDLRPLSLSVSFKQLPAGGAAVAPGSPAENDWDEKFVQSVPFENNQTALLTFTAEAGYTADPPQTRADILKHRLFQDIRVHVFAKHSASQWVKLGVFEIPRQLLAH